MKVFLNRTQLARKLEIAPETLRSKIAGGEISADARDDRGNDLFSSEAIANYIAEHRAAMRKGPKLNPKAAAK